MREPIGASRSPSSGPRQKCSQRAAFFGTTRHVRRSVTVACVQVQPVVLDREATLERLAERTAEAAGAGAELVVFPEAFLPAYPSSVWAKYLAGWADPRAKAAFALLARESVEVPGPAADRLGEVAREHGVWLVTGVNEVDPERPGTIYNSLLYHAPDGTLAEHHRKLVPTNHERLVWGQGDGRGLRALETPLGRIGGLICWENYMPLARFSLYESGVEIYIASTADDGDAWQATLVHIARESRAFVVAPSHFQRTASYPDDFPLRELLEGVEVLGRGGSAILAPDGSYLAGPLYGEEGILYADLEPDRLFEERQRFDAAGHYNRPELLRFTLNV
jgi:nitrilase